jgi:HAD superfamily hydrolase (TIGR01450 family)
MTTRIFLDLDGTVYLGGEIIDAVDVELRRLAAAGVSIHYMTNNTSLSSDEYTLKLGKLNLPLGSDILISPAVVLSHWLRTKRVQRVFPVGTRTFCDELQRRAAVTLTDERPDCVIIAFDRELTYAKLETACGLINTGIPWYLTHIDLACPSPLGPIPDCGAIGRLIEAATGTLPAGHFGKPGDLMLDYLHTQIGPEDRAIVVGDRLYTDAEVGLCLGAQTILVCSGEFRPGAVNIDPRIEIHRTLAEFLRLQF